MEESYNIVRILRGEQFRLGIGGFYPSYIKRTFLVNLVMICTYSITFAQMVVEMNFVYSTTNLVKISEVFLFSMTQIGFINKLINFHLKLKNSRRLEGIISQELFTKVTEKELAIFKKTLNAVQKAINVFLILCLIIVILYGVFPLIDNQEPGKKNYPFPGKFPFNPDNYYLIIYSCEFISIATSAWNNGALDCLFVKHTVIATAFFTILCEKIESILDNIDGRDDRFIVQNRIKNCIIYYDEAIKYVSVIQETFSYGIFIQFLCSAAVICLTGFQLTSMNTYKSVQFILLVLYFICMMGQLVMYCWYGHLLMEKSDEVTRACYDAKWEQMHIKEQKMMLIILERAKRPIVMTGIGLFPLNLSTLMTVLRSSYSYFAVLQRIYRD